MSYFTRLNAAGYNDEQLAELNRRMAMGKDKPERILAAFDREQLLAESAAAKRPAADRFGDLLQRLLRPLYEKAGLPWGDEKIDPRFGTPPDGSPAELINSIEGALLDLQAETTEMAAADAARP